MRHSAFPGAGSAGSRADFGPNLAAGLGTSLALVALVLIAVVPTALAQDLDELDEGVVVEAPFVHGIEPNVWELGLQTGYMNLDKTLLSIDNVVVDVENPIDAIFGSMSLKGQQSFSPRMFVNRTFGRHFALDNAVGFTIGDFAQSVDADSEVKWQDTNSVNELTEEELEKGSLFVWNHEHSLTYYPRGEGRVQPYLSAGAGTMTYSVDSDYIDSAKRAFTLSYGGGLRIVGDDLFSFRLDVRMYRNQIQFDPSDSFRRIVNLEGDARVDFPVSELVDTSELGLTDAELRALLGLGPTDPIPGSLVVLIDQFEERTFNNIWISVGFTAAF